MIRIPSSPSMYSIHVQSPISILIHSLSCQRNVKRMSENFSLKEKCAIPLLKTSNALHLLQPWCWLCGFSLFREHKIQVPSNALSVLISLPLSLTSSPAAPSHAHFFPLVPARNTAFLLAPAAKLVSATGLFHLPDLQMAASLSSYTSRLRNDFSPPSQQHQTIISASYALSYPHHCLVCFLLNYQLQRKLHMGKNQALLVYFYTTEEGSLFPFHALKNQSYK